MQLLPRPWGCEALSLLPLGLSAYVDPWQRAQLAAALAALLCWPPRLALRQLLQCLLLLHALLRQVLELQWAASVDLWQHRWHLAARQLALQAVVAGEVLPRLLPLARLWGRPAGLLLS